MFTFSWHPIFTAFSRVSVCVRLQDNAELTSNSLIPLNNTPQPANSTFEASWMEHAQQHPVNKSLVEASVAVAHLVRPCTDPDSNQGPPTYYLALYLRSKRQTGLRNILEDMFKNLIIKWVNELMKIKAWNHFCCKLHSS